MRSFEEFIITSKTLPQFAKPMKINDKNLCAFAVSATPVDKEGYLNKRGEVNKNFQKRYFVLKGNLLFYFDRKGDKEPVGVIILEGCTIGKICL